MKIEKVVNRKKLKTVAFSRKGSAFRSCLKIGVVFFSVLLWGQDKKNIYDESFDPTLLNEPEMEWPLILYPEDSLIKEISRKDLGVLEKGFRVQVISSSNYSLVDNLRKTLASTYTDEIYLTFDSPYYKLRVGNFRFRSEAEKSRLELVKMGYTRAWIVPTLIYSQAEAISE